MCTTSIQCISTAVPVPPVQPEDIVLKLKMVPKRDLNWKYMYKRMSLMVGLQVEEVLKIKFKLQGPRYKKCCIYYIQHFLYRGPCNLNLYMYVYLYM